MSKDSAPTSKMSVTNPVSAKGIEDVIICDYILQRKEFRTDCKAERHPISGHVFYMHDIQGLHYLLPSNSSPTAFVGPHWHDKTRPNAAVPKLWQARFLSSFLSLPSSTFLPLSSFLHLPSFTFLPFFIFLPLRQVFTTYPGYFC